MRAVAVALALAGCSQATEPHGPPPTLTTLPRALSSAERQLIGASNAFSFALWGRIAAAQPDSNIFISPLSACFALGMTLNGAANQTFDEMRTALQVQDLSQQYIDSGYESLMALLVSLDPGVAMRVANSIWYRRGFPIDQSFIDAARTYFGAQVQPLDFTDVTGSLKTINGWVSQQTNGKIPAILDDITSDDVMFLIDALYFKGSWREQFDPAHTTDDVFTTAPGITQPMRLMHRHGVMAYAETPTYQAVDLPYGNGAFTMTVLLPKPGTGVATLGASLTGASWRALAASFDSTQVELALPSFRLAYERIMNDDLGKLGMIVPFIGGSADFTRMSPEGRELYISFVKQKTFVDVNEEGTEAAAATAVGVGITSLPAYQTMRVDRPFLFVIRERLSGTVLFMGQVTRIPPA